jgi:lipoprotein-anchoring transpeptidase ErfK/SrfK
MTDHSWYYVPPPGQRVKRTAINIERGGRRWSGTWTVEGDILHVESAYGWRTAPARPERNRADRAAKLLSEIVDMRVRP